jgi:predicted transcriptional regulator
MTQSKILASACRRKIPTALSEKKQISMMKLVRAVNSTYNEVNHNLHVLEQEGTITQQHAGHSRIVSLNFENEKTLVLLKLLKIINSSVDLKQFRRNLKRAIENSKETGNCAKTPT